MMRCSACQQENRPSARFCDNCGTPLPAACPACGSAIRPGAGFCDNCGQRLAGEPAARAAGAPAPEDSQQAVPQLAHYIPQTLRDKLDDAQASGGMVGERRVVTMLFCDVKGSTAAAGQLDPEEWAEIMNGAFEHLIAPVYRYEGTVARLMGDALLAFFGAPLAHEDDPQRAILAGLEIVRDIQPYREQVRRRWDFDFDVRVGINTGLVMVGAVGSDLRMEYSALGDAINLAARMEQTAQPGTVQVADNTYKLVTPLFEFAALGGIEVKGKAEPVTAYRVLGARTASVNMRGLGGAASPLTGRDNEIALLCASLHSVNDGHGQVVLVSGEAGLGKSRLLRELRAEWERCAAPAARWMETTSLSYEANKPYSLIQSLLRTAAGAAENGHPDQLAEGLCSLASRLPNNRRDAALATLAALFGMPSLQGQAPLEGETFRDQLYALMPALVQAWTAQGPTAIVLDDLHWADSASVALVSHLLRLANDRPVGWLCAMRPDEQSPAAGLEAAARQTAGERLTVLELKPLSGEDSAVLVERLLDASTLPDTLRDRILARAEGNPFFVEEVVRTLIDSGVLTLQQAANDGATRWAITREADSIELPDNLQTMLVARIDRLEEASRRTLQVAAIIGRSFHYRVLEAIMEVEQALDIRLADLEQSGLILRAGVQPELEYAFRHALMQEAAYKTILRRHRREFHLRVGQAMEGLFSSRLDEYAAALAFHFGEAGDAARALRYAILAGDTAYRLYANGQAVEFYTKAIELALHTPAPTMALQHMYGRRGRALELLGQYKEALANYVQLEALGRKGVEPALIVQGLTGQAQIRLGTTAEADWKAAPALLDEALEIAATLGDRASEARVYWSYMHYHRWMNDLEQARAAGERSLALARDQNLPEQIAYSLNDLNYIYIVIRPVADVVATAREAAALWRALGNQPMLANSVALVAALQVFVGRYDEALADSAEAHTISASIDNRWGMAYSRIAIGLVHWDRDDYAQALEIMHAVLEDSAKSGFIIPQFTTRSFLAIVYASQGDAETGLRLLAQAPGEPLHLVTNYAPLTQTCKLAVRLLAGDRQAVDDILAAQPDLLTRRDMYYLPGAGYYWVGLLAGVRCRMALEAGNPAAAVEAAVELLAVCRRFGIDRELVIVLTWHGLALTASGQEEAARASLLEAQALAERMGAARLLAPIRAALGSA